MNAFWLALQFLTRIPVPVQPVPTAEQVGRSAVAFPVVGLLLGSALGLLASWSASVHPLLAAALLLLAWSAVTGAMHLDGLADMADAWIGGQGERERTLTIMKDPRSGPAGVSAVVLLLLIKFGALATLLEQGAPAALVMAPLAGRAVLPLLFLTTPYVRPGGLGAALAVHLPRQWTLLALLVSSAVLLVWLGPVGVLLLGIGFVLFRAMLTRRLGGTTGDTAGALVECAEAVVLTYGALTV